MTMKSNGECNKGLCHYDAASRTRFFNGMLLTDEHLRAEQVYHREALKRMNRYMWGAGIVCGLKVEGIGGFCIRVHPGFALDCEGNAVELCQCITLDLSDVCKKKYPDGCAPQGAATMTRCLVIRYNQIDDDTVPVLTPEDDCQSPGGQSRSQASRVREGFCLEFSEKCPTTKCDDAQLDMRGLFWNAYAFAQDQRIHVSPDEDPCMNATPDCPTCECDCNDSGICLAVLTIDCDKRELQVKGDCRSYVWSPRLLRLLAERAGTQRAAWQSAAEKRRIEEIYKLRQGIEKLSQRGATAGARAGRTKPPEGQPPPPAQGR